MVQTESAYVQEQNIGIKSIIDYFKENWPRGYSIPYKYIILPVIAVILFVMGSSFIRSPENVYPKPGSTISRQPYFSFLPVRNFLYKDYSVKLLYPDSGEEIPISVYKSGNTVNFTVPQSLRRQARVELRVKINKGIGPLPLWSKSFTYSYTTSYE